MADTFRVGISRDFLTRQGALIYPDLGFEMLETAPGVEYEFFPQRVEEVPPEMIEAYNGIITGGPRYTRRTFEGAERLTAIARFGVGYDVVDVPACTEAGVALFILPQVVPRLVAQGILAFMLALATKWREKEKLLRAGRWADKVYYIGTELRGKTLGSVGLGRIAVEMFRRASSFEMARFLACDPYASAERAADLGVELADLDTVMRESDFVTINCYLNDETRHLIGERELRLMRPTAYVINTARGPIVNQAALTQALKEKWIQGAALDVFEEEPIRPDDPLLELDNVILTPHFVACVDELYRSGGRIACEGLLKVWRGEPPDNIVNSEVLNNPKFQTKLACHRERIRQRQLTADERR